MTDQHQANPIGPLARRVVAAAPELTLAYSCYQASVNVLAGSEIDLYLYGLVVIELIGLAWLRVATTPVDEKLPASPLKLFLGLSGTLLAIAVLVSQVSLAIIGMLLILFADPGAFVLLLVAIFRRSIWQWSWSLDKLQINHQSALREHYERAFFAQLFALVTAMLVAMALNQLHGNETADQKIGDALWFAGMSGYFAAIAIYLLAGRLPDLEEPDEVVEDNLEIIPLPNIRKLTHITIANWFSLLPGVLLLWVINVFMGAVVPGLFAVAAPIVVSLGGWYLLAMAASLLGIEMRSAWMYGATRISELSLRVTVLWMAGLVLFFFSIPLIAALLDLDMSNLGDEPLIYPFAMLSLISICYLLARLWPLVVLPFVQEEDETLPAIPDGFRLVWKMTAGIDGFLRGAMPPVLVLCVMMFLLTMPTDWLWLSRLIVYLLLVPLLAIMMIERTRLMLTTRIRQPGDGDTHTAHAQGREDQPATVQIPVPVPAPASTRPQRYAPGKKQIGDKQVHAHMSKSEDPETSYPDSWTPEDVFFSAVHDQNISRILLQLEKGVSIESRTDSDTAVLWAARLGKPLSVRALLDEGADISATSMTGATLLHYCAATPVMEQYLSELIKVRRMDPDELNNRCETPLMHAARAGSIKGAERMLELGADPFAVDARENTVLHHFVGSYQAFRKGKPAASESLSFLNRLLELGLDPCQIGEYGLHALSIASMNNLPDVLNTFKAAGVDLSCVDGSGNTAMARATTGGNNDAIRTLQQAGVAVDIHSAVQTNNLTRVRELLDARPEDVDKKLEPSGATPISLAVHTKNREMVMLLLSRNADVTIRDPFLSSSVLHNVARNFHDAELARAVIRQGAVVDYPDGDLNTPLNFAARQDNLAVAEVLLEAGADPNAATDRGTVIFEWTKSEAMRDLLRSYGGRPRG